MLDVMASVEEFEAAGLYDASVDADTGRLDLLQWLDAQGFTILEMQQAHGVVSVGLVSLATDRRLRGGELLPRSKVIELSGLSPDDFDKFAAAIGITGIGPLPNGEPGFLADDAMTVGSIVPSMFSRDTAMASMRVIGSSMARIAEAIVSAFLQDIESRHVNAGGSELVQAQQSYEAVGLLDGGLGEQLNSLLRRHTLQAIDRTRNAPDGFEQRFDFRYAVGFVDLVGFTAISAQMSPKELGDFLGDFEGRAHEVVSAAGALVVKFIGDEVMFVSTDPDAACRAASALMSGFELPDDHVVPRGALTYGNVLLRGGDYYGSVVNLASRLVDEAVPQQILVTDEMASAATQCEFVSAGQRSVKGFSDPVRVNSFLDG
jgi:class 3 adenylate cyclase